MERNQRFGQGSCRTPQYWVVVVRRVVVAVPTYGLEVVVVVAVPVVTGARPLVSASMLAVQLLSAAAASPETARRIWNLVFMVGQVV